MMERLDEWWRLRWRRQVYSFRIQAKMTDTASDKLTTLRSGTSPWTVVLVRGWTNRVACTSAVAALSLGLAGCGTNAPAPNAQTPAVAETKPAEPAAPAEMQGAARTLLGSDAQVLVFGDLAKNGNQEFLAANVLPKTPTNNIPGTVVTRAVIVENDDGKWTELLHVDEHLKNPRGYLALTPLEPVTGWRVQYEQDPVKGLQLYFTPEKTSDPHVLPIGVGWNPKVKRYQSLDRTFQKYLPESLEIGQTPRSTVR
jgi:hypothetical protein